ncbi:hypothetical protein [Streptomyces hirsutus]|uniref:hypothetical protein n=1 Tax=Streptomyces hirsutus TaxID=35620 RepID=UPI00367E39A8
MINLDRGHRWDVSQTFGCLPDNPADMSVPDKTWIAIVVDDATGRFVVKSALHTTRDKAIADAEAKYRRR